ncbi:MAG: TraR/DksA C4-type zinc finger protein [Campylobacterota bacterium]|nr:TraR/DksA C4-type zinc finger protein [Campylobacterota bacterium]
MTTKERQEIKETIEKELESGYKEIANLQEKTEPIAPDCSLGRLTRQEMIQEQEIYEHALRELEVKVKKLMFALQRVESKEYGICVECEEEIAHARLLLVPESTHCVACKQELGL